MAALFGASWKSTVIGVLAGVLNYFATLGPNLPATSADWGHAAMSAVLFAFGAVVKDSNISNAPKPVAAQAVSPAAQATTNPADPAAMAK